jgi:hypothetical protein
LDFIFVPKKIAKKNQNLFKWFFLKDFMKKRNNYALFIAISIFLFVSMGLVFNFSSVFASHVVNVSSGGTSFSINDNTNSQFNITIVKELIN